MLYWRYFFSMTLSLTYNFICRSVTYILWYSDFALYFQYYFMNKPHSLDIGSDMGHWPVFSDLVTLNHLPTSAYSGGLKCVMKIFVNVARLEIGQWFTQGTGRGRPFILNTFPVLSCFCNVRANPYSSAFVYFVCFALCPYVLCVCVGGGGWWWWWCVCVCGGGVLGYMSCLRLWLSCPLHFLTSRLTQLYMNF